MCQATPINEPAAIGQLTQTVVLGSAVCVAEGIAVSIAFMLPKGIEFYLGYLAMMLVIWLAMDRFRTSKLGADISDLYFYEILLASITTIYFINGKSMAIFWYPINALLFLKLIRVYAWKSTVINKFGWGVFGFITFLYNKKAPENRNLKDQLKAMFALVISVVLAFAATFLYQKLTDKQREALPWGFAFVYITINGPILLNAIANLITAHFASKKNEGELTATVAKLETKLANHEHPQTDPDGVTATLLANYYATTPEKRTHFLATGDKFVELWPATPPKED